MGLPYRVYTPPGGAGMGRYFLYMYGPNGWGLQITGMCSSCGTHAIFYDMCTQGTTGSCRTDLPEPDD